ncbi:MAG: hypothetical protein IJY36_04795 [Coprobacter sp.]|nr:hypothetical protein [Coprobacter sp.]
MAYLSSTNKADKWVAYSLLVWWVLNLLQAAFTELAHDEAYYFIYAEKLDWGYFDHPPMTALLIALGNELHPKSWTVTFCFYKENPLQWL